MLGENQGSVLGPLLFNIYLNNLLFFLKDVGICNFADDATTYISHESLENVNHDVFLITYNLLN